MSPYIKKKNKNTVTRETITPTKRLFATLQFLASGKLFKNMEFSCAMVDTTIGKVVIETCEAIYSRTSGLYSITINRKRMEKSCNIVLQSMAVPKLRGCYRSEA